MRKGGRNQRRSLSSLFRASAAVVDRLENRVLMSVGPDAFGYVAEAYTYQNIDLVDGVDGAQALTASLNDDDSYAPIALGAGNTFNFYGESYDTVYASTNGLLTFGSGSGLVPDGFDSPLPVSQPAIAPLWDNWNTFNSMDRQVTYQVQGNHLTVEWTVVHNFGSEDEVKFQTILELNTGSRAGDIVFNYVDTNTTPEGATDADPYTLGAFSTVGIKSAGDETATRLVVAYSPNGDGFVTGSSAMLISANQAPSFTGPVGPFTVNEGSTVVLTASASDPEGDALYYRWDLDGDGTFETPGQSVVFDPGGLGGPFGLLVGVQVTDGRAGHEVSVVQIPLDVLNVAPTALNDTVDATEDTAIDINVLANDSDPGPFDTINAVVVALPGHGSLVGSVGGGFTYTPQANFSGVDSFTYVARDLDGGVSSVATVTINVAPVNDAPVAAADAASGDEDTVVSGNVLANDTDVEDGQPVLVQLVSPPSRGELTLNPDGSFTYAPDANFFGTVSFKYRALDTAGEVSAVTDVMITVNPVNDLPVVVGEDATTGFQTPLSGNVLVNDSDVDGDALSATLVSPAAHGSLALDADGRFTYTPAAGFSGTDSFRYQVSDGHGGLGEGVVNISVQAGQEPDPEGTARLVEDSTQPGRMALLVTGTGHSELIAVVHAPHGVEVYFGCESLGVFDPTGRIIVHANGGSDLVYVGPGVQNSAWLYGDDGNDLIKLGDGGGIAFGGPGSDAIVGGNGRDILVGGEGGDLIVGNAGDDILISALTVFDDRAASPAHEDAWGSLSAEWNSAHSFADRVHNLIDGSGATDGLNGSYYLNNSTVEDDHATNSMDILSGSGGNDWYIYKFGEDLVIGLTKTEAKYDLGIV